MLFVTVFKYIFVAHIYLNDHITVYEFSNICVVGPIFFYTWYWILGGSIDYGIFAIFLSGLYIILVVSGNFVRLMMCR
jgi:hypothetical protein